MKQTKFARTLTLLLALVFVCFAFVGCNLTNEPAETEPQTEATTPAGTSDTTTAPAEETSKKGFCTIVLEGDPAVEYRVNLDKVTGSNGLLSALEYLKTEKGLTYSADAGFLTEVGSVKQDADAGKYVYIWTSVEKDFDVSVYASTKTYGDATLTSSGIGAKDMTLTDGAIIYIGLYTWS